MLASASGNPLRQRRVAFCQGIDRIRHLLLGEAAHFGDHAREILQVGVEGLHRVWSVMGIVLQAPAV